MKTTLYSLFVLVCLSLSLVAANVEDVINNAERSIQDGFPKAAVAPLSEAISQASSSADKNRLALVLARVRLVSGQPKDALKVLDKYCNASSDASRLLQAYALAAQGEFDKAAELVSPQADNSAEAALLLARIRYDQGDLDAARKALDVSRSQLSDDPNALRLSIDLQFAFDDEKALQAALDSIQEKALLPESEIKVAIGRLRLKQNRPTEAADIFHSVLDIEKLPAPVRTNARQGLALALTALGAESRAREILLKEISENSDTYNIRETLKQWISLERNAGNDPSANLRSWAAESSRRAIEARLQLARLDIELKRPDAAMNSLSELLASSDLSAQDALRSRLLLAEARISTGQSDDALKLLNSLVPADNNLHMQYGIADLRGRALSAQGDRLHAYDEFMRAFKSADSPARKETAAINAMISALAADNLPKAREAYNLLHANSPNYPDLLRWTFLLAVAEARDGNINDLASITRQSQAAEFAFNAKLALAEWRISRGDPVAAERILRTAKEQASTEPNRAAALAAAEIFTADNSGVRTRDELIKECRNFLSAFPDAPEAPDITFKLGELYALSGDHTAAEDVLLKLSQSLPSTEDAALAKFLAAQSAAHSMSPEASARAMEWFDSIAQGKSLLRQRARLEQASLLLRDRKFSDALTLYDRILSDTPPQEVKFSALMEKADTLCALAATKPEKFLDAAATYAVIANSPDAPPDWRDQATCKRAAALLDAGNPDAALAAYREILSRPKEDFADAFWLYKAGIEAGNILEKQQDWRGAIAVYDLIASADGPQRDELKQRARRLRLEHFIWEN